MNIKTDSSTTHPHISALSQMKIFICCLFFLGTLACATRPDFTSSAPQPVTAASEDVADSRDKDDAAPMPARLEFPKTTENNTQSAADAETGDPDSVFNDSDDAASETTFDSPSRSIQIQSELDKALDLCQAAQDFWHKGELENALQALDEAYSLILQVDTIDNSKAIQQKEDLRFLISKRILEIYASRHIVVNGNHKAIPVILNKHVQNEIDLFTKGREREFFIASYKRSGRYRPYIVEQLRLAGLPESLSWLPLIESGYKTRALSKARALGLWQFIPSTGYKFGLKRDTYIDERLDPVKATNAAIDYLKELHQIFGDWTTVLAAYNCGEGRVLRVIRSQNVNYLDNFWDLYERLPWETARYVPRFLATLHIVNNLEKYGLDRLVPDTPLSYDTVDIDRPVRLSRIAPVIGTTAEILNDLNPELRHKMLPPESYSLRVPKGKGDRLLAAIDTLPASSPPARSFVYHRVRRGQTLSTIAARYKTSVASIARANHISRQNYIVAGKLLKIPTSRSYHPVEAANVDKFATTHTVRRGDSLWIIAKRYGTTTKKIQELNNLANTTLSIGQVLKLPGYHAQAEAANDLKLYRVRPGDSPFTIAMKHNMSLNQFLSVNRLSRHSTIYPGQKLYVE